VLPGGQEIAVLNVEVVAEVDVRQVRGEVVKRLARAVD
jgi:hypothetical protein